MKRQTDENLTSRVFAYGAVPARIAPVKNEDKALEQMHLGNRLWNLLTKIDHVRVERYRLIMRDEGQEHIDVLRSLMDALRDEILARRKEARSRAVLVDDLEGPLRAAKKQMAVLIQERRDSSAARHDARRGELNALAQRARQRIKRARRAAASVGLYWGSYNDIVQRADAARKHGGEMHFRRFAGAGTLTAQVMDGASVARCVGAGAHDTRFQVDPPTPGQHWRYARIRIGTEDRRGEGGKKLDPAWLEVPIVYHRDLPADADIKSVSVTRRLQDRKVTWQLNVTFNLPKPAERQGDRAVAIDIGWRLVEDGGVRVAYALDNRGRERELRVSPSDVRQFGRVRHMRSVCDKMRDEFLPQLAAWLGKQTLPDSSLGRSWAQRSAYLLQWRSGDRLADLIGWWRDNRLPGDEAMFATAVGWRKGYLHVAHFWRGLQDQMCRRLREYYRLCAQQVATDYDVVYLEDFDLRKVAERPAAEDEAEPSGAYRQIASPSSFRGALLNAITREGVRVVKLPAEFSTRSCSYCGYAGKWDQAVSVIHRCEGCGEVWDQDLNACRNLLAAGLKQREEKAVPA